MSVFVRVWRRKHVDTQMAFRRPINTIFYDDPYKICVLKNTHDLTPIENLFLEFSIPKEFSPPSRDSFFLVPVRPTSSTLILPRFLEVFLHYIQPSLSRTFTRSTTVGPAVSLLLPRIAWPCHLYSTTTRLTVAVLPDVPDQLHLFHAFVLPSQTTRPHIVLRIPFLNFLGSPSV